MLQDGWDLSHGRSGKAIFEKLFGDQRERDPGNSRLGKTLGSYLMGMAGRFLPKSASKIKPSTAMNRNWEKVTMFPHPGNSLQARRDKHQSHSMENKHRDPIKGGSSSSSQSQTHPGEVLLRVCSPELVQEPFLKHFPRGTARSGQEAEEKPAGSASFPWEVALGGLCPFLKAALGLLEVRQ